MTPRYFAALCRRRREQRRHEDYMLAQIATSIINFGGRGAKRWFQPRDMMPGEAPERAKRETAAQVNDRIRNTLRGLRGAGNGRG